ncbi:MAG: sugar transferase [Oscillospiraceae bacterium]|nr:sugar transferase [Oscillospiraceae bacterium]
MKSYKNEAVQRLSKLINAVMVTLPFMAAWVLYYQETMSHPFYRRGNWVVIGLFFVLYAIFGKLYDAFLVSLVRISELIYSQAVAAFLANGIMYAVIVLLIRRPPNPVPLVLSYMAEVAMSVIWCYTAHRIYFKTYPPRKTAIIYDMRQGLENLIEEYGMEKKFEITKVIHISQWFEDTESLRDVEVVFVSGVHSADRNVVLKYCIFNDITMYVIPRIGDIIMSGAKKMHMFHLPIMRVGKYEPSFIYLSIKRFTDIVLSLIALAVASPVMLVTAAAIKLTDGGPVFYTQDRLTKDRKVFKIHKFRSMRVDAEKDGVARLSSGSSDDRITPVGRVIRKVRIDELPQLFDILAGNLTIVGPRPERPEIAAQYEEQMPEFALRLQAKAGLTGYAQVYGKYNTTPYDKLQMDLMYIASPSLVQDMEIIFATIKILFVPESTEGVEKGRVTAMEEKEETTEQEHIVQ